MSSGAAGGKLGRLLRRSRAAANPGAPETAAEPVIDIELSEALARAEAAEEKVALLTAELVHKEEILAEARRALRTARVALRDHLRLTEH